MKNYLCVELLNTFSEKEMKGFRHFVSCQHFNTDNYILKLLDILSKDVLGKDEFKDKTQKEIYEKVFAESIAKKGLNELQKKRLSTKLSILTRLAERFLLIEALDENAAYRGDLLYQKMLERRQFRLFNRHITKDKKFLDNQVKQDIQYHQYQHHIEKNMLIYLHLNGLLSKKDNLKELVYEFDMQYLLGRLKLYVTMLSFKSLTKRSYDISSMKAMYDLLDLPQYAENPLIQIYRTTIDFMKHQSEAGYNKLLTLLDRHGSGISNEDLNGFYMVANNFCAQQIREGKFGHRELFELYKIIDEKNLLIEGGFIPPTKLKNAITVGCRTGEFEWAKEMIQKYRHFIRKPIRESAYHFNMGAVAFYQQDYKTALHHLVRVDNINLDYGSDARIMMVKTHYETDKEYDERTSQIFRSTEKYFIENKELTHEKKIAYKNFIRILINIYRIRHHEGKMTLDSIKEKLNRQKVNNDKKWLLEKIAELKTNA